MTTKNIATPITDDIIKSLKAGEMITITGEIYTARDAAHKRLCEMIDKGEELPIDIKGKTVFYAGPCPNKPGEVIGSVGPTTSARMDAYSPKLIERGLRVMIGKGRRSESVIKEIVKHKGLYLIAIGGAAAVMAKCVKSVEIVSFEDLGTEAIRKLYVENMPLIVAIDSDGVNSLLG